MKWSIVIAGIADFARPAEQLSLKQNAALTATGLIWTRWCFVIKPRNIFLASVNFFMSMKEYKLETGKYYRWKVISSGKREYNLVAPEFWRNAWIRQVATGDLEIKTASRGNLE